MAIIDWLNCNSGFITSLLTFFLVLLTGWYAYITHNMLKSNEKANNEQTRPYIIAMIESQDLKLKLYIKNFGLRPALDVKIMFNPPLDNIDNISKNKNEKPHKNLLNQSFMPPNFKVNTSLWNTPSLLQNKELIKQYEVLICYNDTNHQTYNETYIINLDDYINSQKTIEHTSNYHLESISKSLKETKEILKTISNKR
jgi:hypothetical protein